MPPEYGSTLIAYAANDTGRSEVYIRRLDTPGAKYAISNHGGTGPVWSRDGRELFYAEGNKMVRVEIVPPVSGRLVRNRCRGDVENSAASRS